eukprot:TRINITY_DN7058_c0_g1_i1.p1 TRINITY_DN7058_c0_g1~~TRINITY_DN7058_c0_g1_i1.p1  ORF type:complete len:240 (+),score=46.90 TRINITY_DN7058_c0_g1_i1:61-720(+)
MRTHCFKSWITNKRLETEELRYFFMENLIFSYIINTSIVLILHATTDKPEGVRDAETAGLVVLWSAVPFAVYGITRENRGVVSVYVLYGLLAGMGKVLLTVVSTVMVAASCQVGQGFFKGCDTAVLSCLSDSRCTRDDIGAFNQASNVSCEAWATEDCSDAPSSSTAMGFSGLAIFGLIMQLFTSIIPVYFALIYLVRMEVHEPPVQSDFVLQSLNSDE